ncbi:hypothetical protein [Azonexus sp.]|jgi:hypothetical protein|uniref:hypothetical protein n=1 Tax=Azonexus sp. TaxID=1872668 RepID=UPI00281D12BA|nr:hypothetical protein [Azonexus sp.]MDR1994170.1 DUF3304 domain-containing protein [Azonexus sp.]
MKMEFRGLALLIAILIGVTACSAREPETVSLTGIVYNYSNETIAFVRVNGKEVAAGLDEVPNGEVGGGSGMCCFDLSENSQTANVEVTLWDKSEYKTIATIEKWWPDLAHYGVVHILPGQKVVMEVRSVHTWPRKDLMESRFKELGIKPSKTYSGPMNDGPLERTDGVK